MFNKSIYRFSGYPGLYKMALRPRNYMETLSLKCPIGAGSGWIQVSGNPFIDIKIPKIEGLTTPVE
jgi:hypothetical protein